MTYAQRKQYLDGSKEKNHPRENVVDTIERLASCNSQRRHRKRERNQLPRKIAEPRSRAKAEKQHCNDDVDGNAALRGELQGNGGDRPDGAEAHQFCSEIEARRRDPHAQQRHHGRQGDHVDEIEPLHPERAGRAAFEDGHGNVHCRQQQQHGQHHVGMLWRVIRRRPREENAARDREHEAQVNERPPAARRHHGERQHARPGVVAIDHRRAGVINRESGREERADHRQHREGKRAASHRENAGGHGRETEQGKPSRVRQVFEQPERAICREIRHAERRAAQRERDSPPRWARADERGSEPEGQRDDDARHELHHRRHIDLDERESQQRADADDDERAADLRRPVAAREPGDEPGGALDTQRAAVVDLQGQHQHYDRRNGAEERESNHPRRLVRGPPHLVIPSIQL